MLKTVGWVLVVLSVLLAGCGPTGAAAAPRPAAAGAGAARRTAVPTWTLPFELVTSAPPLPATTAPPVTPMPATATAAATATETPTPAATPCAEREGQVLALDVPSPTLRYPIDTQVYLPPCYARSETRYPVLYLIHGLNYTEDQWVRLGMPRLADRLSVAGTIAPLIIVMPRDRLDNRLDPALVDDLVPYIDAHYRTLTDAPHRAIGGLSRGGGWAVHLGLHYPEVFGRIGAHSPAVFLGDENTVLQWTRAAAKAGAAPALYIDIGENDGQPQSAYWLDQIYNWFDLEHTYLVQPGSHTEKYWSAHVADYLRFYAADWRPGFGPPPTATPPLE